MRLQELKKKFVLEPKQAMGDLNATYLDQEMMYDFMANQLCKETKDITVMSDKRDFYRLFQKPSYQGDYHTAIFDFNLNQPARDREMKILKSDLIKTTKSEVENLPSWEDYKFTYQRHKYKAKHATRQWKAKQTQKDVDMFTDPQGLVNFVKEVTDIDDPVNHDIEGPEVRLHLREYWERQTDPRAQRVFKMVHPLVFLQEQTPSCEKIQSNWTFQCLRPEQKQEYLQNRIPNYLEAKSSNYTIYMEKIKAYALENQNEDILSLQCFACHGQIVKGCQAVLVNRFDKNSNYYELLTVEFLTRDYSVKKGLERVYYLVLFACCRESKSGNKEYIQSDQTSTVKARGETNVRGCKPANFTFVFGCNPAEGVKRDTKFVKLFIDHLKALFDPEDGTVMFPECLGVIDTSREQVNFESTSCNIGKSLRLKTYKNRVGLKQLIIIRRDDDDETLFDKNGIDKIDTSKYDCEAINQIKREQGWIAKWTKMSPYYWNSDETNKRIDRVDFNKMTEDQIEKLYDEDQKLARERICDLTRNLLDFFEKDLYFDPNKEVLFMTEEEAVRYETYLIQSKVYKRQQKKLHKKISIFSQRLYAGKVSNSQQMLTVFLSESDQQDVKDFMVNRNPELILNILHPDSWMRDGDTKTREECEQVSKIYVRNLREKLKSVNQVNFNNLNSFFHHQMGVILFQTRKGLFKEGTGQFQYIHDLKENTDRTLKFKFDYLEKKPLRKLPVAKFSIGLAIKEPYGYVEDMKDFDKQGKEIKWKEYFYKGKSIARIDKDNLNYDNFKPELAYNQKDPYNDVVLIMELKDVNDHLNHKKIKKRTKLNPDETGKKYLFAYTLRREDTAESAYDRRRKAYDSPQVEIEGLKETDEVIELKRLHHDALKKQMFFQIVLRKMHSATIGTLDYSQWKAGVDSDKLIKIQVLNFPIIEKPVERDPDDIDEGECSIPFRAWPTEMEFNYYDELKKQEEIIFFKEGRTRLLKTQADFNIKSAVLARCTKGFDKDKAMKDWSEKLKETDKELKKLLEENQKNFRVMIPAENLQIFAHQDKEDQLRFYVLSNRMLINGKNSEMEIEVWFWHPEKDFTAKDKITRIEHDMTVKCRRIQKEGIQAYPVEDTDTFKKRKDFIEDLTQKQREEHDAKLEEAKKAVEEDKDWVKKQETYMKKLKEGKNHKYNRGEKECVPVYEKRPLSILDQKGRKKDKKTGRMKGINRKAENVIQYDRFEEKLMSTEQYSRKVTRVFLRYLIRDADKSNQNGPKKDWENSFYVDRLMNYNHDKEDSEFWLKPPNVFSQSTDRPDRIIFAAGKRGMYIFDLKLEKGQIKMWSEQEEKAGYAFRWQRVPLVSKLDMIADEHISLLVGKQEAKWFRTLNCTMKKIQKKAKETQLTLLPSIVWFPDQLPEFKTTNEDYNRIATDLIRERKRDEARKKNEQIEKDDIDEKHERDCADEYLKPFTKRLKFLFANDQQQISIVNYTDEFQQGQEYLLVKQNAKSISDSLKNLFITYDLPRKSITIHYFENLFDYDDCLISSSYNTFDLSEDFMQMLILGEELLPHEQPKNIKRIKAIKAPTEKIIQQTKHEIGLEKFTAELLKEPDQSDKPIKPHQDGSNEDGPEEKEDEAKFSNQIDQLKASMKLLQENLERWRQE